MPDDTGRFVGRYLQALAVVALLGGVLVVTALVPLVLLLSRRAREEFGAA